MEKNSQGWLEKNGQRFQFTLITNSGNELRKAVLAVAQDSWKKIGMMSVPTCWNGLYLSRNASTSWISTP